MDELKTKTLESVIKAANLIEQCQTLKLITPEDRAKYFELMNDQTHIAIEEIITPAE